MDLTLSLILEIESNKKKLNFDETVAKSHSLPKDQVREVHDPDICEFLALLKQEQLNENNRIYNVIREINSRTKR